EAGDEAELDWVVANRSKHDWDGRGRALGRERRSGTSARDDHGDAASDEVSRQLRQLIRLIVGEAVFNREVLALNIARRPQPLAKSAQHIAVRIRRLAVKEPDHRHRRLLRARRERPRGRAADKRDELAPLHSMTSSARASTDDGISSPSTFAVFRLITISYL